MIATPSAVRAIEADPSPRRVEPTKRLASGLSAPSSTLITRDMANLVPLGQLKWEGMTVMSRAFSP